jgi:hypothetical protein
MAGAQRMLSANLRSQSLLGGEEVRGKRKRQKVSAFVAGAGEGNNEVRAPHQCTFVSHAVK